MRVYVYGEQRIEQLVESSQRLRRRFCWGAAIILAASALVGWLRPVWIFGAGKHAREWVIAALFVFFVGPLGDNLLRWRSRRAGLRESLQKFRIEVFDDRVWVAGAGGVRALRREEIRRAEEVGWGVYLRSARRYRWILIPAGIDGFVELKREIAAMKIPFLQAEVAPNWEEFVGALVFAGTMVCAIFAHSRVVLEADLAVSVMLAVAGFVVVSANPDNLPKMRWARLGVFLPVVMTASMLWSGWR